MSIFVDDEKVVYETEEDRNEILGNITSRINKGGEPPTATTMEAEKRIRREIANSNERRRMQSINNGFQSLRSLLPHHEGEKLSKAAILQQTAEYIYSLEQEKTRLLSQNCQLKRLVSQHESAAVAGGGELPPKKRKTELIVPSLGADSCDEGLGSMSPEPVSLIAVGSCVTVSSGTGESASELRRQLERERSVRILLEDQVRQFESQQLFQPAAYQVEGAEEIALQLVAADSLPPVGHTQTVVCSPPHSRSPSPEPPQVQVVKVEPPQALPLRLPSVLEAAIKAEPKVEVERLPSPNPQAGGAGSGGGAGDESQGRLYVSSTSRQNLETIVEAIRHLEGDHMFGEPVAQEVPLALTTKSPRAEFSATVVQQSQQSRPGVIVVKQAS